VIDAVPARPEDFEALYTLHVAAMKAYVAATYGWDDAFQRRLFADTWPRTRGTLRLVWRGAELAASFRVERTPAEIHLASLEIAPGFQGQGLGSEIVSGLLAEGRAAGLPVTLAVMKSNPRARALYARLGLQVTGATATHFLMRAECALSPAAR
jgi:ribosomal protein S18 acetylase RimI-like enzyme